MASEFHDDGTPLPDPAPAPRDSLFPTGAIPRISLPPDGDGTPGDAAALYPRWTLTSPCESREEFARLHAPYFDGKSVFVFTRDARERGARAAVEVVLLGGARILAGIVEVTECASDGDGPHGRDGMRLQFSSIDPDSSPLLDELGPGAAPLRELSVIETPSALAEGDTRTTKMFAFPGRSDRPRRPRRAVSMRRLERPAPATAEEDARKTTKMTELEIADRIGADGDLSAWSDLLECRLTVGRSGECEVSPREQPKHGTARTVITDITGGDGAPAEDPPETIAGALARALHRHELRVLQALAVAAVAVIVALTV